MIGWFQLKWGGAGNDGHGNAGYEISGHNSAGVSSVYKITTTNKTVHFVVMQSLLTILFCPAVSHPANWSVSSK